MIVRDTNNIYLNILWVLQSVGMVPEQEDCLLNLRVILAQSYTDSKDSSQNLSASCAYDLIQKNSILQVVFDQTVEEI